MEYRNIRSEAFAKSICCCAECRQNDVWVGLRIVGHQLHPTFCLNDPHTHRPTRPQLGLNMKIIPLCCLKELIQRTSSANGPYNFG